MQKDYSWNPSTCICENSKYLKSIADTSVIGCDKIITVLDTMLTEMTNITVTYVTNTALINFHIKKVRNYYILHTVLLAITLLLTTQVYNF